MEHFFMGEKESQDNLTVDKFSENLHVHTD